MEAARAALRGHPGARIARGVKIGGEGRLLLSRGSYIARDARIWVGPGATLTLGRGAKIGTRNLVNVAQGLSIGARTELSWDVQVLDTDFHWVRLSSGRTTSPAGAISIGEHVLVGTGVILLKGITIGNGAIIGAGAVVRRDITAGAIAIGNPAAEVATALDWGTGAPPVGPEATG